MKINEVEKIIGITKKNIRFYEKEGLIAPGRNSQNGYRDYSDEDVNKLEQIKLMRKLGVPIGEIKLMQSGKATVADVMKRHLVTLEREKKNISHSIEFCYALRENDSLLKDLNAHQLLLSMDSLEDQGALFNNIDSKDIKSVRYAGAVIATAVMTALMTALIITFILVFKKDAPPLPLAVILILIPAAVTLGVIYALIQRIGEIKKGEEDYAKKF